MSLRILSVLAAPMLFACASTPTLSPPAVLAPSTAAEPVRISASLSAGQDVRLPDRDLELTVWRSDAFRRSFAQSYQPVTEVEPTLTEAELLDMQAVLELMSANRLEDAIALLAERSSSASSAVFDFTLGNLHFQRESLFQAAEAYEAAVEKFPSFRRAWQNLGLIRVRHEDFADAIVPLTRVIALGGSDGVTYGMLGFAYAKTGKALAAESAYRMAVMLDPETPDWRSGLAQSLYDQQRFADAASFLGSMIDDDPESAILWLRQGNAFLRMEQPLRAAENFELVDQLGQASPEVLNMLGDIFVNEELLDLAAERYLRAYTRAGSAGTAGALRAAKVLTARSSLDGARALLDALEADVALADADRKDALKLRARIAVAEGAGEEEADILRAIVDLDPLDGEALILLGQHSQRSGDLEQAIFYYERAEGLEDFEADARVRHAQALVAQGKYGEALPLLERAQALEPRAHVQEYLEQVQRVAQKR